MSALRAAPDHESAAAHSSSDGAHGLSVAGRALTRQGRATMDRVLDAALAVFARYGLRGSRLDQIAAEAGLSKTNLLYYVRSKDELYLAVLRRTLDMWLEPLRAFDASSDPRRAITGYIERKLDYSRDFPQASRLFAFEIMAGAPVLSALLSGDLKSIVAEKTAIMNRWIEDGRMRRIDPMHLIFMIWATTQHYADFAAQIRAVAGADLDDEAFFRRARGELVERLTVGLFSQAHPRAS
jgi:TetR/AcrR family transcriptional regulator